MKSINILGIESSCDDTSVSVIQDGLVMSNQIYSQWVHKQYGGVVPEMASRQHVESIVHLTQAALLESGLLKNQLSAVAVTKGPGLIGSLLVGISFAKALSLSLGIPLIEVNHLKAHINSLLIENTVEFPMICLTVSGGHTQLLLVSSENDVTILGQTLDDAAGEAFDKTGKLLGLAYPAGAEMDKLAQSGKPLFAFPIAKVPGYNFSFSGLKTSVLYFLKNSLKSDPDFIKSNLVNLCCSIQFNIVNALLEKLALAISQHKIKSVGISGGVAANSTLRKSAQKLCNQLGVRLIIPRLEYCTDNAAMIGISGYYKFLRNEFTADNFSPLARWPII